MMLNKAAKWLLDSELDSLEKGEHPKIDVLALWCKSVSGYVLSVKFNNSPFIIISSQREERRIFKTTDGLIKSLNDVGLHQVKICR